MGESAQKFFTLQQVLRSIQNTLAGRYTTSFWVKAEINKLNYYSHSGHCYPELVEKKDGKVIAQLKGILWKSDYERINVNFARSVGEPLKDGIQVLCLASVQFDPMYGLSLKIQDIDLSFSLGELEREKQLTISRLREEGTFDQNKTLPFPLLPKKVAVISVDTSKGLADFNKILLENLHGYAFSTFLFPALLQGDKSVSSIIGQLKRIERIHHHFDVVAIIRGGGGDVGLSSYNHYDLCKAIAEFPIPVLTGIGHSTNETVSEMVSYRNAITPTELADFLIQRFHNVAIPVQRAAERIPELSLRLLGQDALRLQTWSKLVSSSATSLITQQHSNLDAFQKRLVYTSKHTLHLSKLSLDGFKSSLQKTALQVGYSLSKAEEMIPRIRLAALHQLQLKQMQLSNEGNKIHLLDPQRVLERGYSITLKDGKPVSDGYALQVGDIITTVFEKGKRESEVK